VLAAAVTHFIGLCVAYEYWHERALEVGPRGDVCQGMPYYRDQIGIPPH